jgi:hypothetical protein
MTGKLCFSGNMNYGFRISRAETGIGSRIGGNRLLAGGFNGHRGSYGWCVGFGSENQAVKKPRFRGGSGAAEVLVKKGILDTLVSQPASGVAWLEAIDGSLRER